MSLEVIILAAGLGKRMHSVLPKVLHPVAGKPMLFHVIETAAKLNPVKIHVVLGHKSEVVADRIAALPDELKNLTAIALQTEQLGTAHAVAQAMPQVADDSDVLILYGDTPLTPEENLRELLAKLEGCALSLLTAVTPEPTGYGRIVRNESGAIAAIVEEKDASPEQKLIREVNTGMMAAPAAVLKEYLKAIGNNNAQHEYYLTDLIALLVKAGRPVCPVTASRFDFLCGVNDKVQLSFIERLYQHEQALRVMREYGATLADPARFDLRGSLKCGQDVFIDVNCVFTGRVVVGNNVTIGAGCVISDCTIGDNSVISPYTVMEKSELKVHTTVGPFARLRPGNVLEDEVHVGNFVEVKNSHLGFGTKSGHLSYLGDSSIGRDVNIGAGTITCNYDGAHKHRTTIEDDVFIGSDTQLVAPVTVHKSATVGAGTTVTRDVPAGALIVTRARPRAIEGYERPRKDKKPL